MENGNVVTLNAVCVIYKHKTEHISEKTPMKLKMETLKLLILLIKYGSYQFSTTYGSVMG